MTFLLDTNTCIGSLNRRNVLIEQLMRALPPEEIRLCEVVRFELYYSAYRSSRQSQNIVLLRRFFGEFLSLPFDSAAAITCSRIRAQLTKHGTPIGSYDLQIAAIALVHGLTLVTHNTREFSRVEGLQLEDWEIEP